MASKEIQLTIGERLAVLSLFKDFKGNLPQVVAISEDIKAIIGGTPSTQGISDADWEKAGMTKTGDGEQTLFNWKEEGSERAITLSQEAVDYLLGKIKTKSEAGEFTLADKIVADIEGKLK